MQDNIRCWSKYYERPSAHRQGR